MKKGEKGILIFIAVLIVVLIGVKGWMGQLNVKNDPGLPFYSTASKDVSRKALEIYKAQDCRSCHALWGTRDMMQHVPAPALDGIGAIRDEKWLFNYFSAQDPGTILPSRLKKEYRMPSYAFLPEEDRRVLAKYMSSLKVKDWYLKETKKSEYEKLTGKKFQP